MGETTMQERFDKEAEEWDTKPDVRITSERAFEAICQKLSQWNKDWKDQLNHWNVLEIGCGTGLLSTLFAPLLYPHGRLLGVDTSPGMIAKFESKKSTYPNITGKILLLETKEQIKEVTGGEFGVDGKGGFDMVTSHLVFHHIPSMLPTIQVAFSTLRPNGVFFISDFLEDLPHSIAFHPSDKMEGVERHGLNPAEMVKLMKEAGFVNVECDTAAFKLEKEIEGGEMRTFPFVLCKGNKPAI